MAGSITEQDRKFVETWEHISPSSWGIVRLDARGEDKHEIISGRRTFMITTEERLLTQDRIGHERYDPFLNGSFRPVVVPDSITIESNPNALSDEEIERILSSSEIAWQENLKVIDSVATIRRMLEVAENVDGVTVKRYRQLENYLVEIRGVVRVETKDEELKKFLDDKPAGRRTVTAGTSNPRRQGGRSSDYR